MILRENEFPTVVESAAYHRCLQQLFGRTAAVALLCCLFSAQCLAADVAFSNDNQRVYTVGSTDNVTRRALRELDLSTKKAHLIPLVHLDPPDEVRAVAPGDGGNILFITGKTAWAFDTRSSRATKLCSAPGESLFVEIAYDGKSHAAYVTTTENGALFMVKNGRDLVPVSMRRHEQISCLTFSSEGELFYKESGDIWRGKIKSNEDSLSVEAEHYAPGRELSSVAEPPEGLEYPVVKLVVARDGIYVQVWSYHNRGRGFGALLKLPPPLRNAGAETNSRIGHLTAKKLADTDYPVELGSSADGSTIYYKKDDGEYLVTNGRTQKLQLREIDQKPDTGASTSIGANATEVIAEPPSSPAISSDAIATVAEREIDAISSQNVDTLVSIYADKVDLLDKGMVNKDTVQNDLQQYFDRWPITKWKLAGKIDVKALNGSRYQVTFPVTFEVANPATNRRIIGTANETRIVFVDSAGTAKIVYSSGKK
jgi:hypothetical protein